MEKLLGIGKIKREMVRPIDFDEDLDGTILHNPFYKREDDIDVLFTMWAGKPKEEPFEEIDEMRTKQMKIDGKDIEAVLMAGGPGFKIYSLPDDQGVLVAAGRNKMIFKDGDSKYKTAMGYVNLRYQPAEKQAAIKDAFMALVKSQNESNQLEPEIQTIVLELSDKIKDIVGDDRIDRLKMKPMDKWNKADILLAKNRTSKKHLPVEKPEENFLSYRTDSIKKNTDECLIEMKILDSIYKMIMTAGVPNESKPEGKNAIYSQIEHILENVLKPYKGTVSAKKKYDSDGLMGIDCKVKLNGEKYAIHTYYSTSSKHFYMALWDDEELNLLLMLTEGYLREKYYLVGVGKMRLKSFLGDHHGE